VGSEAQVSFRDHGVYVGNQAASVVAVEEFHIASEFFLTDLVILNAIFEAGHGR
jgi:hypothetical protein